MLINIPLMKGEVPRIKSHLLSNEAATIAKNCKFNSGILTPLLESEFSETLSRSGVQTLFRYLDTYWLNWVDKVSVINSPIAQDQYERIYWTGQGKPKVAGQDVISGTNMPAAWYDLGVPAPTTAPIITNINTSTGSEPEDGELASYDDEDRLYLQTFVTAYGEEGPNGDPSSVVAIEKPGSTITILLCQPAAQNTHNVTKTRLYRSVTEDGEASYQLVAELPISQTVYYDSATDIDNAVLETENYTPPDEDMQGLTIMSNGICAGYAGNEVMFSEAYLPYAWNEEYRATTEHEIVGIVAIETSLVVATKGYPYLFSGVTPSMMTGTSMKVDQACVSADSIVSLNGLAVYASPDGLVAVSSSGAQVITTQVITRDQWQKFKPETLKGWSVEGMYVGMTDTIAFYFDPVSLSFVQLTRTWECAFNDLVTDQLYFVDGTDLYAWKAGSDNSELTWRSKSFLIPSGTMLTCAKITADHPELLVVTFYADDVEILTINKGLLTNNSFRLPAFRGKKIAVEVSGAYAVEQIQISSSMSELS